MSTTIPEFPVTFTEGDLKPSITGTLCDVDITGYTVTMHLERTAGDILIKNATITDAANGRFVIDWAVGDLLEGCGQLAEIQFLDPSAKPVTSRKFVINVDRELA